MPILRWTRALGCAIALLLAAAAPARADCPPAAPSLENLRPEALRADVRDRGFLWQLKRDGRISWLYGTVHVSRPEWALPGERISAALRSSDVLALELDPSDPELPRAFAALRDAARADRVTAGLAPRLARAADRECVNGATLAAMPPILQVATLSLAETRRDGLHPELAVDVILWSIAQAAGKKVVALETPAAQLAALVPASEAEERQLVVETLDGIESGEGRDLQRRLLQAWGGNDQPTLASYPQWCRCLDSEEDRRYFRRVNDERNLGMADRLVALHAGGRSFFAAVGALHMTGPQALQDLLRTRGFQVEAIALSPRRSPP